MNVSGGQAAPLKKIEKACAKHIDSFNVRPAADVPDVVYHYTTAAALKGMLETGRLWATDYRFLNDSTELQYGLDLGAAFVSKHKKDAKRRALVAWIDLYRSIPTDADYFLFSLSENRDDLSQWRGYAADGAGFTIGFSGQDLRTRSAGEDAEFAFAKVCYDSETHLRILDECFEEIFALFEAAISKGVDQKDALEFTAVQFDLLSEVLAVYSKHKSFRSENEWRMCSQGGEGADVKVRPRGTQLVPYIELCTQVETASKLPVVSIGIGPGHAQGNVRKAVEALCHQHGYEPEIYTADTPYRRL